MKKPKETRVFLKTKTQLKKQSHKQQRMTSRKLNSNAKKPSILSPDSVPLEIHKNKLNQKKGKVGVPRLKGIGGKNRLDTASDAGDDLENDRDVGGDLDASQHDGVATDSRPVRYSPSNLDDHADHQDDHHDQADQVDELDQQDGRDDYDDQSFDPDCSNCFKLRENLANTKLKFEGLMTTQHEWEAGKMHRRLGQLEEELEAKDNELEKMRTDMEILGQKLIDEIEKRADLAAAQESVQGELEELTQTLFEEANTLVANEARERHGAQEKQQVLARQLHEVNMQLQLEQAQSRELRVRLAQLEQERESTTLQPNPSSRRPSRSSIILANAQHPSQSSFLNPDDLIDPFLFEQFEEMIERGPRVKMTKIHEIPFMQHALEDDVSPCLRFGGNPRTSTKKFIDAIVANTCFIELMTDDEVIKLQERDTRLRRASATSTTLSAPTSTTSPTPTMSLFNKTMLERITNALAAQSISADTQNSEREGCSTCGRLEKYQYRFKISDVQLDVWYPICTDCRLRLVSVLDFYQFIRNMRQGLFSAHSHRDLYFEVLVYKRIMFYARIGCAGIPNVEALFRMVDPVCIDSSSSRSSAVEGGGEVVEEVVDGGDRESQ